MQSDTSAVLVWHAALMQFVGRQTTQLFKHPWAFGLRTLKGFRANQGLLLAGPQLTDKC